MESFNGSLENITDLEDEGALEYTVIGVAHIILVVVPCVILGPIVLLLLCLHFKKSKDPVSLIFIFITILCTVAQCTYALLMDVSLISDQPTIGKCGTLSGNVFRVLRGFGQMALLVATAVLSIIQYLAIARQRKHLLKTTAFLLTVPILAGVVAGLPLLVSYFYDSTDKLRGSLCVHNGRGREIIRIVGVLLLVFGIIPATTVITLFSVLSFRHVKLNIIDNGNIVKSVLKIMIFITISVFLFRSLPIINFFIRTNVRSAAAISWGLLNYTAEFSFPLYLILIISVHKTVRNSFIDKLKLVSAQLQTKHRHSQVAPSVEA